jgi:hypothetical protein
MHCGTPARPGLTARGLALFVGLVALAAAAACSSGAGAGPVQIVVATLTPAPPASAAVPLGGKPAVPPTGVPAAAAPTSTPQPPPTSAPTSGRWIDVDVTHFTVRLMEGSTVLKTIAPVAVGAQIDTGAYESTQTGLFYVYNKVAGLQYDAPYKTYISDWVGFDPQKANGFHSFLKDANGNVVDSSTGRISNGCIRTGDPAAIFEFAQIGMPVLVHT